MASGATKVCHNR